MPASEELSANDSSLFAKVGMWIFVLAVLLVVSLILLNVLDVEGAITFLVTCHCIVGNECVNIVSCLQYIPHRRELGFRRVGA